jgi:hypothetical protein
LLLAQGFDRDREAFRINSTRGGEMRLLLDQSLIK